MRRCLILLFVSAAGLFSSPSAHAQAEYPFVGQIIIVPFNFAPKGWMTCDGQILTISGNTALFSLLGTTFGGDGVHTFALPDLRGRMPIGAGQGPGLSLRDMGENGGEEQVTLTVEQMPSHTHVAMGVPSAASAGSPGSTAYWATPRALLYSAAAPDTGMNGAALTTVGGGQPHDNLKPYLVMNYIIATQGVFPPRD